MGYEVKPKQYRLKFEDHDGLEVVCSSLTVDEFLGMVRAATSQGDPDAAESADDEMLRVFEAHLIEWNITQNMIPVPANRNGIGMMNIDFIMEIIGNWMGAIASVDIPLPQPSNGSGTLPEQLLPMEPLSQNP